MTPMPPAAMPNEVTSWGWSFFLPYVSLARVLSLPPPVVLLPGAISPSFLLCFPSLRFFLCPVRVLFFLVYEPFYAFDESLLARVY